MEPEYYTTALRRIWLLASHKLDLFADAVKPHNIKNAKGDKGQHNAKGNVFFLQER
jgi:hypothetical protein